MSAIKPPNKPVSDDSKRRKITPPIKGPRQRRKRVQLLVLLVVVALVIAGGTWAVVAWVQAQAERCPGLDGTSGDGFALSKSDDQCIGWIVERDYAFGSTDQNVKSVISKITEENRRVRDQQGTAEGKPYVRVGVLMPMTSAPGSSMRTHEILHALQGAYAAQKQANEGNTTDIGDPSPLIQLVLANEGRNQDAWSTVVDQLGALKSGEYPLVAVTGLGISIKNTLDAAQKLSDLEVPSIGSLLAANTMVAPWLFKVTPSNLQYAQSLNAFLTEQPSVKTGYMVFDRNGDEGDDEHVRTLRESFIEVFEPKFGVQKRSRGYTGSKDTDSSLGTPLLFADVIGDVCILNPDVIFFAGRGRDLLHLIKALESRARCQNPVRPLAIAIASPGLNPRKDDLDGAKVDLDGAKVGVLDAAATHPVHWMARMPETPQAFAAFHERFTALGFPDADLNNGYAILHRDAVAAAVWAARRDARAKAERNSNRGDSPPISELPTATDVRSMLFSLKEKPIPGASGAIYFRELPANDLRPVDKPVPIIRIGSHVEGWTSSKVYLTQ